MGADALARHHPRDEKDCLILDSIGSSRRVGVARPMVPAMERDGERLRSSARRPRTAAEHITQRWAKQLVAAPPSPMEEGKSREPAPLVNRSRLFAECAVLIIVILWLGTIALLYATRAQGCHVFTSPNTGRGRFVHLRAYNGRPWRVGGDGVLSLAPKAGNHGVDASLAFAVEWEDDEWFCLRWLGDMRLLEVVMPPAAQAWTIRTGKLGCTAREQRFTFRQASVFSLGAGSFVNVRNDEAVRAHGDRFPWTPQTLQTRQTALSVTELPDLTVAPAYEAKLLRLVAQLDAGRRDGGPSKNASGH